MQPSVLVVLFLLVIARTSSYKIVVRTSNAQRSSELVNAVVNIVKTCYDKPGSTVGIIGKSDPALLKALWSEPAMPVILIDENTKTLTDIRVFPRIHVYIIAMSTWLEFLKNKMSLYRSVWWDSEASYLIIDESSKSTKFESCKAEDDDFIKRMANMNNVKVLCLGPTEGIEMFVYRSRGSKGAPPWEFHRDVELETTTLTQIYMFARSYRDDDKLCMDPKFDKKTESVTNYDPVVIGPGVSR